MLRDQPMVGRQDDDEPLLEDRHLVQSARQFVGHADDRDLQIALFQQLDHLRRAGVDNLHFDTGMLRLETDQQIGDQLRPDRAHRADRQRRMLEFLDRPRLVARSAAAFLDGLQVRKHHPPKLGQMRVAALAVE